MFKKLHALLFLLCFILPVSAKFIQEVELQDGTRLEGYVYVQQPNKYIVFHSENRLADPHAKYLRQNQNYSIPWRELKYIRRGTDSDIEWFEDKITLKNGTVYIGNLDSQEVGKAVTVSLKDSGNKIDIPLNDIKLMEKIPSGPDKDIWLDRQFVNKLILKDNSVHEGLIVVQYYGENTSDCYVELLHGSGYKERIYLPDIKEFIIKLR